MSMSYAAHLPCGCIVAATVDSAEHPKETAKYVAGWIRAGLRVERVTTEYVRQASWHSPRAKCPKETPHAP